MSSFSNFTSAAAPSMGVGSMRVGQSGQIIQQFPAQGQQWNGQQSSTALPTGASVMSFPTLAAAQAQLQGCQVPTGDTTVYVPRQTLVKEVKNYSVTSYRVVTSQVPVTSATNVQVIQHPVQQICEAQAAAPCEQAVAPCVTGACAAPVGGSGPSWVSGNVSQTPFRY